MKERYIGENLRLISDVLEYSKNEDLTGILVSLDFRKAFDTLEWPFIKHVLNLFNFGESVKRWISIFYTVLKVQFSTTGSQRIGLSQQGELDKAAPCHHTFLFCVRKYYPIKSARVSWLKE